MGRKSGGAKRKKEKNKRKEEEGAGAKKGENGRVEEKKERKKKKGREQLTRIFLKRLEEKFQVSAQEKYSLERYSNSFLLLILSL